MIKQEMNQQRGAYRVFVLLAFACLLLVGPGQVVRGQTPTPTPLWTQSGSNISNTNTGNVGVGTAAPNFKLEVQGAPSRNTMALLGDGDITGYAGLRIGALSTGNIATNRTSAFNLHMRRDSWYGGDASGPSFVIETISKTGGFAAPFLITPTNDVILNGDRGASGLTYGRVGVGTTTPGFRFDVQNGQINASGGLCIAGDCKTAWSQITGTPSQWTTSGANVYYNAGAVGIGTATPGTSFKLDVAGSVNSSGLCLGGDCKTAWSQLAGTPSQWTTAGSSVFYNTGTVGIGTNAPNVKLAVGGPGVNVSTTDLWVENNFHAQGPEALVQGGRGRLRVGTAWGYAGVYADSSSTGVANDLVLGAGTGNVRIGPNANVGAGPMSLIIPNGNLGVGTTAPNSRLHIYSSSNTYLRIGAPLASQSAIGFNDDANGQDIVLYRPGASRDFVMWTAAIGDAFRLTQSGSIGIGIAAPNYKLDVQGGQVNASGGLCIAGDCKSSWGQVGGASQWTTSGTNVFYNGGRIGIGTDNPSYKLQVNGGSIGVQNSGADAVLVAGSGVANEVLTTGWSPAGFGFIQGGTWGNTPRNVVIQGGGGNLGVGVPNPTAKLDVNGNVNVTGDIVATGNIAAKYQDVAEWVPSTQKLQAGTVVVLDTGRNNHVLASTRSYDTKVAGVISASPGVILGVSGDDKLKVATTGRVKIKVDARRGAIHVGDLLVTSDIEGVAMKSMPVNLGGASFHRPGTILGKALEPLEKGTGEILALLSLQ